MRSCPQLRGMGLGLSWRPARSCGRVLHTAGPADGSFADKGVSNLETWERSGSKGSLRRRLPICRLFLLQPLNLAANVRAAPP
jgi:hypothetical protein